MRGGGVGEGAEGENMNMITNNGLEFLNVLLVGDP